MNRQSVETELKELKEVASVSLAVANSPESLSQYEDAKFDYLEAMERIKFLDLLLKHMVK